MIFFGLTLFGQSGNPGKAIISGRVTDSVSRSPLDYATITIYSPDGKKPINGAATGQAGDFTITGLPEGTFRLLVECIGYRPLTIPGIRVDRKHMEIHLGEIRLTAKQQVLQNVTVVAQGKLVENRIDKMVYNAEKDLTAQSGVATDVLRKVPMVSVDVDGNVELAGTSGIRFLINGKPSSLFGSNIADVLQAIPANQIQRIEVITNPGARYDAQGLGGIINIVLKKNNAQGLNGNLSLAGGTRMNNGSFNLNARKGKLGLNAYISGNLRPVATTPYSSDRLSLDTLDKSSADFYQDGQSRVRRQSVQTGLGFDWTYRERNNFSGSVSYNQFGFSGSGLLNQSQSSFSQTGALLSQILSRSATDNHFRSNNVDASLNYKRTFRKEDEELEISLTTSSDRRTSSNENSQWLEPKDSLFYGISNRNPGTERETDLEINYTYPFTKKVVLGTGGKLVLLDINSNADVLSLDPASKELTFNPTLSNFLNYHQRVYAVYAELGFPVGHWFDAKIGSRLEHTDIHSFYSNAQAQVPTPGYNTLVPSVFLSRKVGDKQHLRLSYSRRIERPDYGDLNPFINTADPKNISAGNPYLKPEIGNRYELGYQVDLSSKTSLIATLFYRANNHDIQPYIVYYPTLQVGDSTYTNVSVSTRENVGLEKNVGVSLFGEAHLTSQLSVRSNLFFFHRHITNALDPGYDAHSFNYRINLNADYQFNKTLAGEFFGNFNSPRNEVQGKYPSFMYYSFALRKQFWNRKGSLALTTTNPFGEYVRQRTSVFGPNFSLTSLRRIPFRSFGLNFTWKFGKLEFKKDKQDDGNLPNLPAD